MAHVKKVKASGVIGLLLHDFRYENDGVEHVEKGRKIDSSRTGLNRLLVRNPDGELGSFSVSETNCGVARRRVTNRISDVKLQQEAATGKRVRKDAVEMVSVVVTLPHDWPEELEPELFFAACLTYLEDKFGRDNVPIAAIHYDETTPHMHALVIPEQDGRFAASKLVNRQFLREFHPDLQAEVEKETGVKCAVLLDADDKYERALSKLDQEDMKTVRDHVKHEVSKKARVAEIKARNRYAERLAEVVELGERLERLCDEYQRERPVELDVLAGLRDEYDRENPDNDGLSL